MVACDNQNRPCAPKPCHRDPESGFHLARKENVLKAGTLPDGRGFGGGTPTCPRKAKAHKEKRAGRGIWFLRPRARNHWFSEKFETKIGDLDDFRPNSC